MSKRFTDTEKWKDAWFLDLSLDAKLLFIFFCDTCDLAGFYERHDKSIAYYTGIEAEKFEQLYQEISKSVLVIDGLVWIKNFIRHQKNLPLNSINNAHKHILKLLSYRGEIFGSYYKQVLGLSLKEIRGLLGACKGVASPIGKDKGIGNGKDKAKKEVVGEKENPFDPVVCDLVHKTAKTLGKKHKEITQCPAP